MKNILFCVLLLLVVGVFQTKAQSSFDAPWPGATHTYDANVSDPDGDDAVRWYVALDADGTKATYNTHYTFAGTSAAGYNAINDQFEGVAVYSVQIRWEHGVALGTNYFVFIEVDNNTTGCTNKMALRIQTVAAPFNLLVYNVSNADEDDYASDESGAPNSHLESCPSDPTNPVFNGGAYDLGYTELVFRVERQNTTLGWNLHFGISEEAALAFMVDQVRIVGDDVTTQLAIFNDDPTANTNANKAGATTTGVIDGDQDFVLVFVRVRNQTGTTLNIRFSVNNSVDAAGVNDSNIADNWVIHRVKAMPAINGFTGS